MLISVLGLQAGCGQSTCAVNLACELAGLANPAIDRWQGKNSVILSATMPIQTHYCAQGHLPVSCDHLPLENSRPASWIGQIVKLAPEVDFIVIDPPPELSFLARELIVISDLIVVPSSSNSDLEKTAAMIDFIKATRSAKADGGPKCLIVPTRVYPKKEPDHKTFTELERFGEPFGPAIHELAAFADAFQVGRWIGDFAFGGPAHRDIEALAASVKLALNIPL